MVSGKKCLSQNSQKENGRTGTLWKIPREREIIRSDRLIRERFSFIPLANVGGTKEQNVARVSKVWLEGLEDVGGIHWFYSE